MHEKKTILIGKERQQIWFDLECKQSRQVVRRYLHNYHNGNSDIELVIHKRETSIKNLSDRRKINIDIVLDTLQKCLLHQKRQ